MVVSPARNPAGGVMVPSNGNRPAAPPFDMSTRLQVVKQAQIARPAGGGLSPGFQIPTNGLLAGILLAIRGTVGGTVGTVNALGMSSIVRRVTLTLNSGTVVFSMSGPGYHYLYTPVIDSGYVGVLPSTVNARSAVTATGAVCDMFIPLQVNMRDPIGLLLLQNRQTILTLGVEWEADANVTSTGTFANFYAQPYLLVFSVPPDPMSLPPLRYIHQVLEDSRAIAGAGTLAVDVPRGNTYERIIHGAGIGVSGSDAWSAAQMRVNQANYIFDTDVQSQDMLWALYHGTARARVPGFIGFDMLSSSGLGSYGTTRDLYDSDMTTDLQTVLTFTGATTLYTVREQLVDLRAA